jgi:hypothetical protein
MEAPNEALSEIMKGLKESVTIFDYRRFIGSMYQTVRQLVKSRGESLAHRRLDTGSGIFRKISAQSERAKQLAVELGYREDSEVCRCLIQQLFMSTKYEIMN